MYIYIYIHLFFKIKNKYLSTIYYNQINNKNNISKTKNIYLKEMEKKEYRVSGNENAGRAMFHIKEMLQSNETMEVTAGTKSSEIAVRAVTTLERLGYITIENIKTLTILEDGRRIIKLIVSVKKTAGFDKLFKEHEEERKKREEQRQKEKATEAKA